MSNEMQNSPSDDSTQRAYEAPSVTVMDEKDVLKTFQITSAGISWWA